MHGRRDVPEAARRGAAGDNIGVLLRGIEARRTSSAGRCWRSRGRSRRTRSSRREVYVLTKEEGGRHTPFFNGLPAAVLLPHDGRDGRRRTCREGVEMVMPGDNVEMAVELITPIAMEKGLRFAIREGGRTVGAGTVTEIIE
ncbi:MAG: hypothetical protein MZV70_34295 [Desulfobacterales bacterium]|nr:hypothetical protein [Desulfobacterales bacterium]